MWNPLGIVGVITAFNFPCAVLGKHYTVVHIMDSNLGPEASLFVFCFTREASELFFLES